MLVYKVENGSDFYPIEQECPFYILVLFFRKALVCMIHVESMFDFVACSALNILKTKQANIHKKRTAANAVEGICTRTYICMCVLRVRVLKLNKIRQAFSGEKSSILISSRIDDRKPIQARVNPRGICSVVILFS